MNDLTPHSGGVNGPGAVVLRLDTPFRQRTKSARQSALMQRFSQHRRGADDVFWLKENAELLGIFASTGVHPDASGLDAYQAFYENLPDRIGFFPQYYRFFLSLALDLEDLGMAGDAGARLVDWVARSGLVEAELSDLQRAEARRLCTRCGVDPLTDAGLNDRLRAFSERSATFALPNKKAAYELTHIVFYLSDYGRKDPDLGEATVQSLYHAGTLAFLELNIDLLSEICVALRFTGQTPPALWERWLRDQVRVFAVQRDDGAAQPDDYHPWLMLNWFMEVSGQGGFAAEMPEGGVRFGAPRLSSSPLRELSQGLQRLGAARSGDWQVMLTLLSATLSEEALFVVNAASEAVDFQSFFATFARATGPITPIPKPAKRGAL